MPTTTTPPPPSSRPIIRPALQSDIPAIASLATATFFDAPLSAWLFPRRHDHPRQTRAYWLRDCRDLFWARGVYTWVCVEAGGSPQTAQHRHDRAERDSAGEAVPAYDTGVVDGNLIGVSVWCRRGSSPTAEAHCARNASAYCALTRLCHALEEKYISLLRLDGPAVSPTAMKAWLAEIGGGLHRYVPAREHWHCSLLVVDPSHQGRGVGTRLMRWGVGRCGEEGVPGTLIAAEGALGFYKSAGWRIVDYTALDVEGTEGGGEEEGGAVMVWDAQGGATRRVEGKTVRRRGRDLPVQVEWIGTGEG